MKRRRQPRPDRSPSRSPSTWVVVVAVVAGAAAVALGMLIYDRLRPRTLEEQVLEDFGKALRGPR
jgi:hypothetical protein